MATVATSILIGSSSFLQVIRACINALMSSNFSQILLVTETTINLKLVRNSARSEHPLCSYMPLSVWKTPHRYVMGEML